MGSLRTLKQAGKEADLLAISNIEAIHAADEEHKLKAEYEKWVSMLNESLLIRRWCLYRIPLVIIAVILTIFLPTFLNIPSSEGVSMFKTFFTIIGVIYLLFLSIKCSDESNVIIICKSNMYDLERKLGWVH